MSGRAEKTLEELQNSLDNLEKDIIAFIKDNAFYLPFQNKGWASSTAGQKLIAMTVSAINLGYHIKALRSDRLSLDGPLGGYT